MSLRFRPLVLVLVPLLLGACDGDGGERGRRASPSRLDTQAAVSSAEVERARQAVAAFKQDLMTALAEGLREGPAAAITVCEQEAPRLAGAHAEEGLRIGRTSHKLRNPANAPEPWMEPLLEAYRSEGKEERPPYRLVRLEEDRVGYVEPIHVVGVCLNCHGTDLSAEVRGRLAELYPEDEATGFTMDDFRGLFWVELPAEGSSSGS